MLKLNDREFYSDVRLRLLGVDRQALARAVADGTVRHVVLGRLTMFRAEWLTTLLASPQSWRKGKATN